MFIINGIKNYFRSRKFKRRNRNMFTDMGLTIFLGFFALFSIWPLVFVINNAFKPLNEIFIFPPRLFVMRPTLDNFRDLGIILENSWIPVSRYIFNTIFYTVLGTAGCVFIATMAAFPLAKYKFPGSGLMSKLIVYSLMFNATVTAIPNYFIMSKVGLIDTYWAVILPTMGGTLGLFLMKNFIVQIPDSLIESAKIDGASEFTVLRKIIFPLCKPAVLTLVIIMFQAFWGTTGGNFIYTEKLKPVCYALGQIIGGGIARTGAASAVTLIMLTVPIIMFIICQSNVLETMATSGIKG